MNPKNTLMLVALAAGLFAFIYFFERNLKPPAPVVARVLPGLKADEITSIQILPRGQYEIRVERSNGVWQLTRPLTYPVQAQPVADFLKALVQLMAQDRISAEASAGSKNPGEDYGLDKPSVTIIVQQGDNSPVLLKLGNPTAPGDGVYAQVVSRDWVEIISADFPKLLPADGNAWRDTAFVKLEGLEFDRLGLTNGSQNQKIELQREPGSQSWRMNQPTPSVADKDKITALLSELQQLKVKFLPDTPQADPATCGLRPPQLDLTLSLGTNQVLDLQFGKSPTNDDSRVYARAGESAPVVLIARDQLTDITNVESAKYRSRNLVSITSPPEQDSFNTIEVSGPDGRLDFLVKDITNGAFVSDAQNRTYAADPNEIKKFILGELLPMQIAKPYLSNNEFAVKDRVVDAQLADFGLAITNPMRRIKWTKSPKTNDNIALVVTEVDFGLPNTNMEGTIYARRGNVDYDKSVYAVKTADFLNLPTNALDLRERRIWNFDVTNTSRLTVKIDGRTMTWERKAENRWPLANGIADGVKGVLAEQFVVHLGELEALAWVEPADESHTDRGFRDDALHVTVGMKDGTTRAVELGGAAPGGLYATTQADDGKKWIFIYSTQDARILWNMKPWD